MLIEGCPRAHVHAQMCGGAKPKNPLGQSILQLSCPPLTLPTHKHKEESRWVSSCCFFPVSGPGMSWWWCWWCCCWWCWCWWWVGFVSLLTSLVLRLKCRSAHQDKAVWRRAEGVTELGKDNLLSDPWNPKTSTWTYVNKSSAEI